MSFWEIVLIGVGLAMDAFAVSIAKGLKMTKIDYKKMMLIALFFGGFQALMPTLGWLLGIGVVRFVTKYTHWIAFALLFYVGGKMLLEGIREKDESDEEKRDDCLDIKELFILAIATSIDAFAVGITFSFYDDLNVGPAVGIIGLVTFVISALGVVIGNFFGAKYRKTAVICGGVILIFIGLKILLEGFGLINLGF